jgi:acetyl-CoA synthetase
VSIFGFDSYEEAVRSFRWSDRWSLFETGPDDFNLADQCIDRFVRQGRGDDVAVRVAYRDGSLRTYSYRDVQVGSGRVRKFLADHGITRGAPVLVAVDPGPVWVMAQMACLRMGAPMVPASAVVGPGTVVNRVLASDAKVAILPASAQEVIDAVRQGCPGCTVVDEATVEGVALDSGIQADLEIAAVGGDAAAWVYSSGTTGAPKRTSMSHRSFTFNAVVVGKLLFDLQPEDRFLKAGSTAWGGAFSWGVAAPLLMGTAAGIYSGPFDADAMIGHLAAIQATAFWAPPVAIRRIAGSGRGDELSSVTRIGYAGEAPGQDLGPLVRTTIGAELRGHYGATEIGLISLDYAFAQYEPRPGSAGKPLFGVDLGIIDEADSRLPVGEPGAIAVYRNGRWHRTGDQGYLDKDSYLWVTGRADDVIISSGYTIGPYEVEDALRADSRVAEAAVVGVPDPERGTVVKAYVQLVNGDTSPDESLSRELANRVRNTVGRYAYPRLFEFVETIPRGANGKIARNALRAVTGGQNDAA